MIALGVQREEPLRAFLIVRSLLLASHFSPSRSTDTPLELYRFNGSFFQMDRLDIGPG